MPRSAALWSSLFLVGCPTKRVEQPDGVGSDTGHTSTTDEPGRAVTFTPYRIGDLPNPAWASAGDLDGDGSLDLVVAATGEVTEQALPPGVVRWYTRAGGLDDWSATDLIAEADGVRYPNQPTLHDLDGDGDLDVVVPSGGRFCAAAGDFCGSIRWLENRPGGFEPHVLFEGTPLFYTAVEVADLDGDGNDDLVACSEWTAFGATQVHLFRGLGGGQFANTPLIVGEGGGPFPTVRDLDGDGDRDVMSGMTFDTGTTFAWYENRGTSWQLHPVLQGYGPGWQISWVPDLYGDGVGRAVGTNHTNTARAEPDPWDAAVLVLDPPADPRDPWEAGVVSDGIVALPDLPLLPLGAPGTFARGDADGDGDLDLAVAGDGDPNVYLLEQTDPGSFTTRILANDLGQSAGTLMEDLDGDGAPEIVVVSGREDAVYVVVRE